MLRPTAVLLSASLATASWGWPQEVSSVALPAAGGTISSGPYTCTTSIGTVDGAVSAKAGTISIKGGFICVEPYYNTTCVADVDQSGSIDSGDISILLLLYGPAIGPFKFADLDRNGFIDSADLSLVLLSYGEDCAAQSLTGGSSVMGGQLVEQPDAPEAESLPLRWR